MSNIRAIQMHLSFEVSVDALSDIMGVEPEEAIEMWDEGTLQEKVHKFSVNEFLTDVEETMMEYDLDCYGGIQVGSGVM